MLNFTVEFSLIWNIICLFLTATAACRGNEFNCGNGHCVPSAFVCNGYRDCPLLPGEHESSPPKDEMHCMYTVRVLLSSRVLY